MTTTVHAATTPTVPPEFVDFAFEWKLGWDAGEAPNATCPITRGAMMAHTRREAWKDGYSARRRSLGDTSPYRKRLAPIQVRRAASEL